MASDEADRRKVLGIELTDRMLRLGFNQSRLAARSGISVATIRKLQNGVAQGYEAATLYKLAEALGWNPQELTRRANGKEPVEPLAPPDTMERIREQQRGEDDRPSADELRARDPAFQKTVERLSDDEWRLIKEMAERLLGEST